MSRKQKVLVQLSIVLVLGILSEIECVSLMGAPIAVRTINDVSEVIFCVIPFNLIPWAAAQCIVTATTMMKFP